MGVLTMDGAQRRFKLYRDSVMCQNIINHKELNQAECQHIIIIQTNQIQARSASTSPKQSKTSQKSPDPASQEKQNQ